MLHITMTKKVTGKEQKQSKHGLEAAENHFKEACEMFQREAVRLRQEQGAIDAILKKMEQVHFSSTIQLNVGGHRFTTSLQTLTKDPNSMLAAMFSGKFEMKPCEDGAFFIDRDGTHFRFILNYLRNGKLTLPDGATFLKELADEAEFYQVQGIIEELKPEAPKSFEESVILTNEEHRSKLKGWLPQYDGWHLLFRSSRDGFTAHAFHSKCDDKGPTVTIVKSGDNIFGGFTEMSWNAVRNSYLRCSQSFLFSMVNPYGLAPSKMPLVKDLGKAIYCGDNFGPVFGGGNDLFISENANSSSNITCLGHTYQCPTGYPQTFFTSTERFTVADYEVFGIHKR